MLSIMACKRIPWPVDWGAIFGKDRVSTIAGEMKIKSRGISYSQEYAIKLPRCMEQHKLDVAGL